MATAMIQHSNHNRTVRALGISLLLLVSLAAGGCACLGDAGLSDLCGLLSCSHRPQGRRTAPCDPCYGFHPTCWHTWPEYCAGLPPGGTQATARPADLETLPTPPQEPHVNNLPPPPAGPSAAKELATPPLPDDGPKAPLPDNPNTPKEDAKKAEPQAREGAELRPGEEAVFPRFSYYEMSLNDPGDDDPGASSVAIAFACDALDPWSWSED